MTMVLFLGISVSSNGHGLQVDERARAQIVTVLQLIPPQFKIDTKTEYSRSLPRSTTLNVTIKRLGGNAF
jgi:hypothetical protein